MNADQHTGYHRNRTHCGLPSTFPALFLLLILEGAVPAVRATTKLEADWNKRPMPHSSLTAGGPQAQMHMVAIREVLGDTSANTAKPADLKARIQRGGAFPSYLATAEPVESSMVLETAFEIAITSYAVEARLDTQACAAVFTPYLAAGFQIEDRKARP